MIINNSSISFFKMTPETSKNGKNRSFTGIQSSASGRDIFVKSNKHVSFGHSQDFQNKFDSFSREIESYAAGCSDLKLEDIESIVKKYSPTTSVKHFDSLPDGSNALAVTQAYFTNQIKFTNTGKAVAEDKAIYLRFPKDSAQKNILEFLDSLEHEFTHILQEESKDRTSKVDFLNSFLKGKELNLGTVNTLSTMPKAFSSIEYNFILPFRKILNKKDFLPVEIQGDSDELLKKIYMMETGFSPSDFARELTKYVFKNIEANGIVFDRQAVADYIVLVADKEKEAYANTARMLKKYCNINGFTDLDLRVKLYEILQKTVKQMKFV